MPSSLHKARKAIAKKRNGVVNALHVKSRDSFRLRKASCRDERLGKLASARSKKEGPIVGRVAFFQDAVIEKGGPIREISDVQLLIHTFIHQYDEEYAELQKTRRAGRPASMKEDLLKLKIDNLESEYDKGFSLPDVMDEKNVKQLEEWTGSWTTLAPLSWIKVTPDDTVKSSEIPTFSLS